MSKFGEALLAVAGVLSDINNNCQNQNNNDDHEFEVLDLCHRLKKMSFDSQRLDTARMYIRNCPKLTADDISKICSSFSFSSTKYELARETYDRCVDKQNYYKVVSEVGMFYSSDLTRYISKR